MQLVTMQRFLFWNEYKLCEGYNFQTAARKLWSFYRETIYIIFCAVMLFFISKKGLHE